MLTIEHVEGHPSDKVATFKINQDLLGIYEKIAIPRSSKIAEFSPLAQTVFARGGDANRVDFFAQDGDTYISIARKIMPWDEKSVDAAKRIMNDFFQGAHPVLYLEALAQNFTAHTAFNHGNNPVKKLVQATFFEQVNPLLAKDGGAMELLDVEVKPTGEISSDVALLGSCNSCTSAQDTTLKAAAERIRMVLDVVKQQYAGNPAIAALEFKEIRISNMDEIILSKQ